MKKNSYNRRQGAFNRLEEQIRTRRLSREFHDKLKVLPGAEQEKAIVAYWDRKTKELANIQAKLV